MEEGYKQWVMQMNEWMNAGLLDSEVMTKIGRSTMDSQILTGVTLQSSVITAEALEVVA